MNNTARKTLRWGSFAAMAIVPALLLLNPPAQAQINVADYAQLDKAQRVAYVGGVYDTLNIASAGDDGEAGALMACIGGQTYHSMEADVWAVIGADIRGNAIDWQASAVTLIVETFSVVCDVLRRDSI